MSYAQAAARGPKQTPEEALALLLFLRSYLFSNSTRSFQAQDRHSWRNTAPNHCANPRRRRAAPVPELSHDDESTSSLVDVDSPHVSSVPSDYESQSIKTDTQASREENEHEDEELKEEAKEKAQRAAEQAKEKYEQTKKTTKTKASSAKKELSENRDNPVVVGNAVVVVGLSAALGFGAYRKYAANELTWKVVGAWVGVVGLFAAGDYYLSQ
ncbi:MAG: hypothetical protein M1827_001848 [Pycnora praestabilis]|nr:MAG: hypothetical protein M1827_001848 [Pycnora praestabilis]